MASSEGGSSGGESTDGDSPAGVLELLGLLAYAELIAFFRLSDDAALAPSLSDKAALAEMAVAEFGHFQQLRNQISRMGAVPEQAMQPFVGPLDAFHARTAPGSWLEGLVKAYVGDGIAADFYRAVAELLDPQTRELVLAVLADTGHAEFVTTRVRAAVSADPAAGGRLALWARRLVGEALAQAHRVVAERSPLARLLAGATTGGGGEQGEIGRMFARLTDAHDQRMRALGLERLPAGQLRLPKQTAAVAEADGYRLPKPTAVVAEADSYRRRSGRLQAAEADPALLGAGELHVADLVGRHHHLPALVVGKDEEPTVGQGRHQGLLDLLRGDTRFHHQFPRDGLDPDLDFHGAAPLRSVR
jgi:hypothetical protein